MRGRQIANSEPGSDWTVNHRPGANLQATKTQPALTAGSPKGTRNVCTGLSVMLCAGVIAPTPAIVTVALIDGPSGGTTYLWGPHDLAIPSVAGASTGIVRNDLFIQGSPLTAMTLEFSVAAGANTYESISLQGETL